MPFERNLTETDETCPDCGATLDEERGKFYCRQCGSAKIPASAQKQSDGGESGDESYDWPFDTDE